MKKNGNLLRMPKIILRNYLLEYLMTPHYYFFALTRNITDADVRCIFILRYIGIPIIHNKIAQDFHTNLYFMLLRIKIVRIFFYDNM